MRARNLAAVVMLIAGAGLAAAADGPHGGIVRETANLRIELVVAPRARVTETEMLFILTDRDGRPVPAAGASGRAQFSSGVLRGTATLHPHGANTMIAHGLMSAQRDLRIDATITLLTGTAERAVFEPLGRDRR